ncbi:MAG TPA: DUF6504 family protein [Anaerolineae bacterium]|nr:DUF6504 family protein [Anaerolineae bacterium]
MSLAMLFQKRRKDPIRLLARRHNYFPKKFMWRGQQYTIYAVSEAWTEMKRKGAQHFFRVRCKEGTFDIYQDLALNAWYLAGQVE